jgi:hypothetical protein
VIDDPEVSPGCTEFCTGGGTARGHRRTSESDLYAMGMALDHAGIPYKDGIADHDLPRAVHGLYRNGFGYHKIADVLGRGHEEIYDVLTNPL